MCCIETLAHLAYCNSLVGLHLQLWEMCPATEKDTVTCCFFCVRKILIESLVSLWENSSSSLHCLSSSSKDTVLRQLTVRQHFVSFVMWSFHSTWISFHVSWQQANWIIQYMMWVCKNHSSCTAAWLNMDIITVLWLTKCHYMHVIWTLRSVPLFSRL